MFQALCRWFRGIKTETNTQRFNFSEFPPVETEPVPDEWDIEMTVPLRMVAGVFAERGWQLSRSGELVTPSARHLAEVVVQMIMTLAGEDATYHTLARFMVINDSDFPGDVDIYLHIGTATPKFEEAEEATSE